MTEDQLMKVTPGMVLLEIVYSDSHHSLHYTNPLRCSLNGKMWLIL